MKRLIVLFATLFALMSCGQREVVWEDPIIGTSQYGYIKIKKVVLSKDKTTLYMSINYPSMGKFRFAKETYIRADGNKYAITGSDSITLGEFTSTDPDTWDKGFTLYFEPLPKGTQVFDLLEGTKEGDYTFFNIHPKDYALPTSQVPADFLADYPGEDEWPAMEYSEEPITIHFQALNFNEGVSAELDIWHFDITDPAAFNEKRISFDSQGTALYTAKIYYPQDIQITYRASSSSRYVSSIHPHMAPGQELTVLMDMNIVADEEKSNFVGYKGYMAKYNLRKMYDTRMGMPRMPIWSIKKAKTVADIIAAHDSIMNADREYYDNKDFTELEKKHFYNYELRFFSIVAERADSLFRSKEFLDYITRTRPACFFDDSFIEGESDFRDVCHLFAGTKIKGIGPDFCRFLDGVQQVRGGKQIKKPYIEDPYLSNLYDRISGNISEQIAKNKRNGFADNVHYLDLEKVAPENILQNILDRYKGKTVVFDMWATWCAYCIKGHNEMASYKKEIADKDIVFVYIATTNSPFNSWMDYTRQVPGEHYYLTEEQDNYLSDKIWGAAGVPKYAIFDKDGQLIYKQVGWGGLDKIKPEIEKTLK